MNKFKIQITGARDWDNLEVIYRELSKFDPSSSIVIHGDATGADTQAGFLAEEMGFEVIAVPAHWRHTSSCPIDCNEYVGRAAGPIRNRKMANLNADLVLAFHKDISTSKGTKDMVQVCKKKGMEVRVFSD